MRDEVRLLMKKREDAAAFGLGLSSSVVMTVSKGLKKLFGGILFVSIGVYEMELC